MVHAKQKELEAIMAILQDNPQGLSRSQIAEKLKFSNKFKDFTASS